DLEQRRPPAENCRLRAVVRGLGRGRIKGAESHIIRAVLARLHREVTAVVAGPADLRRRAEHRSRLANVAVGLAEVDPIGAEALSERNAVVDDEGDARIGADALKGLRQPGQWMLV